MNPTSSSKITSNNDPNFNNNSNVNLSNAIAVGQGHQSSVASEGILGGQISNKNNIVFTTLPPPNIRGRFEDNYFMDFNSA